MKFTFEESEFLNSLFENKYISSKQYIVNTLETVKENTGPEFLGFIEDTINKIKSIDESKLIDIFNSIPIIPFANY